MNGRPKVRKKHGASIHGVFEWHRNTGRANPKNRIKINTMNREKAKESLVRIKNGLMDLVGNSKTIKESKEFQGFMESFTRMMKNLESEEGDDSRLEWFNNIAKSFKGKPEGFGKGNEFMICLGCCEKSSLYAFIGDSSNLAAFLLAHKEGEIAAEFLSKALRQYESLKDLYK